jgi:predicted RNA-binding protein Jag
VILKPNNSFYRRLQHQRAVELGFDSFSVGEGPDRSVRIARKDEE